MHPEILQLALTALLPSLGAEDDARFAGHLCVEFLGEVLLRSTAVAVYDWTCWSSGFIGRPFKLDPTADGEAKNVNQG